MGQGAKFAGVGPYSMLVAPAVRWLGSKFKKTKNKRIAPTTSINATVTIPHANCKGLILLPVNVALFNSTSRRVKRRCNNCGTEKITAGTSHMVMIGGRRTYCGFLRTVRD